VLELVVKVFSFGFVEFWAYGWNRLDLILVGIP